MLEQMDGPSEELTGARCLATKVCQIDSVVKGRSDGLGPASGAARRDAAADDVDEDFFFFFFFYINLCTYIYINERIILHIRLVCSCST